MKLRNLIECFHKDQIFSPHLFFPSGNTLNFVRMKVSVLIMKRKFRPRLKAKEESKSENHSVMSGLFATPWTMEFSRPEYWSG